MKNQEGIVQWGKVTIRTYVFHKHIIGWQCLGESLTVTSRLWKSSGTLPAFLIVSSHLSIFSFPNFFLFLPSLFSTTFLFFSIPFSFHPCVLAIGRTMQNPSGPVRLQHSPVYLLSRFHIWTLDNVQRIRAGIFQKIPFHTCSTQQEIVSPTGSVWAKGAGGRTWYKKYAAVVIQHFLSFALEIQRLLFHKTSQEILLSISTSFTVDLTAVDERGADCYRLNTLYWSSWSACSTVLW